MIFNFCSELTKSKRSNNNNNCNYHGGRSGSGHIIHGSGDDIDGGGSSSGGGDRSSFLLVSLAIPVSPGGSEGHVQHSPPPTFLLGHAEKTKWGENWASKVKEE